jgi:hypothetical protein
MATRSAGSELGMAGVPEVADDDGAVALTVEGVGAIKFSGEVMVMRIAWMEIPGCSGCRGSAFEYNHC